MYNESLVLYCGNLKKYTCPQMRGIMRRRKILPFFKERDKLNPEIVQLYMEIKRVLHWSFNHYISDDTMDRGNV